VLVIVATGSICVADVLVVFPSHWNSCAVCLHHASCRTPEQQGREDDEGEGWRLAVDAKSDLWLFRLTEGLFC
jgi:hypothetical protein